MSSLGTETALLKNWEAVKRRIARLGWNCEPTDGGYKLYGKGGAHIISLATLSHLQTFITGYEMCLEHKTAEGVR